MNMDGLGNNNSDKTRQKIVSKNFNK